MIAWNGVTVVLMGLKQRVENEGGLDDGLGFGRHRNFRRLLREAPLHQLPALELVDPRVIRH